MNHLYKIITMLAILFGLMSMAEAQTIWCMSKNGDGHLWLIDVANNRHSLVGILSLPDDPRINPPNPTQTPFGYDVSPNSTLIPPISGQSLCKNAGPITCEQAAVWCWNTVTVTDDKFLYFVRRGTPKGSVNGDPTIHWIDSTHIKYEKPDSIHLMFDGSARLQGVGGNANITGLCTGPDGNLYFAAVSTDAHGQGGLWRFHRNTKSTEFVGQFAGQPHDGNAKRINRFYGGLDFNPIDKKLYGGGLDPKGELMIYVLPGYLVTQGGTGQTFPYITFRPSDPGNGCAGGSGVAFDQNGVMYDSCGDGGGVFKCVGTPPFPSVGNSGFGGTQVPLGNDLAVERTHSGFASRDREDKYPLPPGSVKFPKPGQPVNPPQFIPDPGPRRDMFDLVIASQIAAGLEERDESINVQRAALESLVKIAQRQIKVLNKKEGGKGTRQRNGPEKSAP